jgi:hypothetical protein
MVVDLLVPLVAVMPAATAVHGPQHARANSLRHTNNNQISARAQKLQQDNCGSTGALGDMAHTPPERQLSQTFAQSDLG